MRVVRGLSGSTGPLSWWKFGIPEATWMGCRPLVTTSGPKVAYLQQIARVPLPPDLSWKPRQAILGMPGTSTSPGHNRRPQESIPRDRCLCRH